MLNCINTELSNNIISNSKDFEFIIKNGIICNMLQYKCRKTNLYAWITVLCKLKYTCIISQYFEFLLEWTLKEYGIVIVKEIIDFFKHF